MPMIISRIQFLPLKVPLIKTFTLPKKTLDHLYVWACEVITEDGVKGRGYTYSIVPSEAQLILKHIVESWCDDLIGCDIRDLPDIHAALSEKIKSLEKNRYYYYFLSAIDIACWDLMLIKKNQSLAEIFKCSIDRVEVYGSGGWLSYDNKELLSECQYYIDRGVTSYKIKAGQDVSQNERRLQLLRDNFSASLKIYVDANLSLKPAEAIEMALLLEEYDAKWFEEPIIGNSAEDLKMLKSETDVPLASGENCFSIEEFHELIASGTDYIQPDIVRCGGVTSMLKISELCRNSGRQLFPHLNPELSAVFAALSGGAVEHMRLFKGEIFSGNLTINSGLLSLPSSKGTGVYVKQEVIDTCLDDEVGITTL
jgi:L-alanine-DL-glutamate epimerase-like enolase superfamily enzyme